MIQYYDYIYNVYSSQFYKWRIAYYMWLVHRHLCTVAVSVVGWRLQRVIVLLYPSPDGVLPVILLLVCPRSSPQSRCHLNFFHSYEYEIIICIVHRCALPRSSSVICFVQSSLWRLLPRCYVVVYYCVAVSLLLPECLMFTFPSLVNSDCVYHWICYGARWRVIAQSVALSAL